MSREWNRTQYIVDREYQLRFVMNLIYGVFGVAMATFFVAILLMWVNLDQPGLPHQQYLETYFAGSLLAAALTLMLELLIAMPVIYFWGTRHTNRVVGPLQRIDGVLEAMGKGDFSRRLVLREGDVLMDLAERINGTAEELAKRFPKSD